MYASKTTHDPSQIYNNVEEIGEPLFKALDKTFEFKSVPENRKEA